MKKLRQKKTGGKKRKRFLRKPSRNKMGFMRVKKSKKK